MKWLIILGGLPMAILAGVITYLGIPTKEELVEASIKSGIALPYVFILSVTLPLLVVIGALMYCIYDLGEIGTKQKLEVKEDA